MSTHNSPSIGTLLIVIGAMITITGLVIIVLGRLGVRRLPGDILIQKGNATFFFPVVSCIVISVVLSIVMTLLSRR